MIKKLIFTLTVVSIIVFFILYFFKPCYAQTTVYNTDHVYKGIMHIHMAKPVTVMVTRRKCFCKADKIIKIKVREYMVWKKNELHK